MYAFKRFLFNQTAIGRVRTKRLTRVPPTGRVTHAEMSAALAGQQPHAWAFA